VVSATVVAVAVAGVVTASVARKVQKARQLSTPQLLMVKPLTSQWTSRVP
jgi:hypothetical protein